jgi:peptide/nickel transport system ATP-binding protein
MPQPVIAVEHLSIEYKLGERWVNALHDISLEIQTMEMHGLVGESGSGKSTLALALMRYMAANARISSGSIRLDGEDITHYTPAEMRRLWGRKVALVPQDPLASLNPSYTVGEQIAEAIEIASQTLTPNPSPSGRGAFNADVSNSGMSANAMLERVRIADPAAVAKRYPHQLSGGMQQRVVIAMALSAAPRLLVLDEPTTALDVTTQATILDLVRELVMEQGAAALLVSHDLALVAQMCDRVTVLYGGEIMSAAPSESLWTQPLHPYTISLLASRPRLMSGSETRLPVIEGVAPSLTERPPACVFATRCPVALAICHDEKPPLETATDGGLVRCHRWHEIATGELRWQTEPTQLAAHSQELGDYVLSAAGMEKSFYDTGMISRLFGRGKAVWAVDGVNLNVRARSTLALVGESGSGKTTLARLIVGLERADAGELELMEMPLDTRLGGRGRDQLRNLQMVFQNPNDALNPYMTVGQALARPIRRLTPERLSNDEVNTRVAALLNAVRLTGEYAARYPSELSGGEKQRVAIARAFAAEPALVIADEPTSSLDVSVQGAILNLLKDLRAQQGVSYLLITHDLKAVSYLADWVLVMYLGEIVEEGTTEQVFSHPSHPYTEALISAVPRLNPAMQPQRIRLDGDVPSARAIPSGCRFHTRCPRYLGDVCVKEAPPWRDAGDGHFIRCHIPVEELAVLQALPAQADGS